MQVKLSLFRHYLDIQENPWKISNFFAEKQVGDAGEDVTVSKVIKTTKTTVVSSTEGFSVAVVFAVVVANRNRQRKFILPQKNTVKCITTLWQTTVGLRDPSCQTTMFLHNNSQAIKLFYSAPKSWLPVWAGYSAAHAYWTLINDTQMCRPTNIFSILLWYCDKIKSTKHYVCNAI